VFEDGEVRFSLGVVGLGDESVGCSLVSSMFVLLVGEGGGLIQNLFDGTLEVSHSF
jgi:hypothetical protein